MLRRKIKKYLCSAMLSVCVFAQGSFSYALPENPHDMANISDIATADTIMDITGTGNALIKWEDFSINTGETVNFGGMDKALNVVDGIGNTSHIMGNLNAPNIDLFIMNPNGIIFGKDSSVNTGSLYASTNTLTDEMKEQYLTAGTNPLTDVTDVTGDIAFVGDVAANKLVVRGKNISILHTDNLDVTETDLRVDETGHVDTAVGEDITNFEGKRLDGSADAAINRNDFTVITSEEELKHLSDDGHYMLDGGNMTLSDSWEGIKNTTDAPIGFTGVLNGMGATISGLNNGTGFFSASSAINGGEFKNFTFKDNSPTLNHSFIVDNVVNNASIRNIRNIGTGTITYNGNTSPTGLFGVVSNSSFHNVVNKETVTATDVASSNPPIGGLIGMAANITVTNSKNSGDITGTSNVGGLIGNASSSSVTDSENSGDITGESNVGGFGGMVTGVTVTESKNSGVITGTSNVGGIIGSSTINPFAPANTIDSASNTGNVSGNDSVGGIIGNTVNITVTDSKNDASVSGTKNIGGIMGQVHNFTVENVANNGDIQGSGTSVGGIIGSSVKMVASGASENIIKSTFNNGKISSTSDNVGGIIGSADICLDNSLIDLENVTNYGEISGKNNIGGLIGDVNKLNGENSRISINEGKNFGDITGQNQIGGLIGHSSPMYPAPIHTKDIITNSLNEGKITASSYGGGLTGMIRGISINDSKNNGEFSNGYGIGGIAGYAIDYNMENVENTSSIEGTGALGGIIGLAGSPSFPTTENVINNANNTGNIFSNSSSHNYFGGIIGLGYSEANAPLTITNAINKGKIGNSTSDYSGGIVGLISNTNYNVGTIKNSKNFGDVLGDGYIGGIVGQYSSPGHLELDDVSNSGNVFGDSYYIGGIVGLQNASFDFKNTFNIGNVSAENFEASWSQGQGGIIGWASPQSSDSVLENVYNTGNITQGTQFVGGLIGYFSDGNLSVKNSYNTGMVSGKNGMTGGLLGDMTNTNGTILLDKTYNLGDVVSETANNGPTGGLIGYTISKEVTINQSFNSGNVVSHYTSGGLIGIGRKTIVNNSYNSGKVIQIVDTENATNASGGIIGTSSNDLELTNVYNAGNVSGKYVGGLLGIKAPNKTITLTNTHYLKSEDVISPIGYTGSNSATTQDETVYDINESVGNTMEELKTASTYEGFDLDEMGGQDKVWRIYEGNTTPWLTTFMKPATIGNATKEVDYDGNPHTVSIADLVSVEEGEVDATHVLGNDVTGTAVGTYKEKVYSDQLGYNFKFNNQLDPTQYNTVFLKINAVPEPEPVEPEPTDPDDGDDGGNTDDSDGTDEPDDGDKGDSGTNTPDDGNKGDGGTKEPDDGNKGDGGTKEPDDGNKGDGGTKEPDDGNKGDGGTKEPDDGNKGDGGTKEPDDGNKGDGGTNEPDDGNKGDGGTSEPDDGSKDDTSIIDTTEIKYDVWNDIIQPREFPFQKGDYTDLDANSHILYASDDVIEEDEEEEEEYGW